VTVQWRVSPLCSHWPIEDDTGLRSLVRRNNISLHTVIARLHLVQLSSWASDDIEASGSAFPVTEQFGRAVDVIALQFECHAVVAIGSFVSSHQPLIVCFRLERSDVQHTSKVAENNMRPSPVAMVDTECHVLVAVVDSGVLQPTVRHSRRSLLIQLAHHGIQLLHSPP